MQYLEPEKAMAPGTARCGAGLGTTLHTANIPNGKGEGLPEGDPGLSAPLNRPRPGNISKAKDGAIVRADACCRRPRMLG